MSDYKIKVLDKALKILDAFNEKGKELSSTQIYQALNLNKTTAFRILKILEDSNYLERSPHSLKYRLGFKLYCMGSLVEGLSEIQKIAHPFLVEMVKRCDETVHLAILSHGEALYLDKLEGQKALRIVSRVGMRLPAHCSGVGKILLAFVPEEELEQIIAEKGLPRFTRNTITSGKSLRGELAKVRKQGYAVDNEEIIAGAKCVAAPVRDSDGDVLAAISISVPKGRLSRSDFRRTLPLLIGTAGKISEALKEKSIRKGAL